MTTTFTPPTLNSTSTNIDTRYSVNFSELKPITIPTITAEDLKKFNFTNASNYKTITTSALKFDEDKPSMNLLSRIALEETAKVMDFGKEKYDAHNWRKGFAWSRPLSAAMRHIMAFNDGENKDPESGLSHLAHAACCIMFLLEFEKTHQELDDRFKPIK
jgi:hypothetical protein